MALRGASGDQWAVPVTMSKSTLPYCAQSSGSEVRGTRVRRANARDPELEADVEDRTGEFPKIGDPEYLEMFSIVDSSFILNILIKSTISLKIPLSYD